MSNQYTLVQLDKFHKDRIFTECQLLQPLSIGVLPQVFDSWVPVWCAYLFFLMGLVLQRLVMLPVAAAVFQQEAAEGAFRYGHTRFRAWAAEIAMYR
jgi:ABC-type uncharacterized transport system fused permease/ATPase subunit